MASEEATWSISLGGDVKEVSEDAAKALEEMRQRANQAEEAIKRGSAALRGLRGSSDEVKTAKEKLKAQIDAERTAFSSSNLEILKQGSSLKALNERTAQHQKEARATELAQLKAAEAAKRDADQSEGLNMGLLKLLGVSRETRMKINELGSGFTAAELASAGLVAGSLALVGALVGVGYAAASAATSLVKFTIAGADTNKQLQLSRQWIAGSAEDSARMGDQIDRLRQKIPLTTEELSKLYAQTRAGLDGTRVSGQGILDVVEGVGTASGAGASAAAAKIDEIIRRGAAFGRTGINIGMGPLARAGGELAGTGLKSEDVTDALAEDMNISVEKAAAMLRRGVVPIGAAAKALREAAEKDFGQINLAKMATADAITNKWHDDLIALTRGAVPGLQSFWEEVGKIESVFSTTTTSGYALKQIVSSLGTSLGIVSKRDGPELQTFLRLAILEATKLNNAFLRLELQYFKTFPKKDFSAVKVFEAIRDVVKEIALDMETIATMYGQVKGIVETAEKPTDKLLSLVPQSVKDAASSVNPFAAAGSLPGALAKSFGSAPAVRQPLAVQRDEPPPTFGPPVLASQGTTRQPLSLVRDRPVAVAPAHAAGGTVVQPAPGEAFASVAPGETIVPRGGFGGARGGGASSITIPINLTIQVNAHGTHAKEVAAAIQASSFLADLEHAIATVLKGQGIPTQTEAA
jgi:hypothetical protein